MRGGPWLLLSAQSRGVGNRANNSPVGASVTVIESEKELFLESSGSCGMEGRRREQQAMHRFGVSPADWRGMYRDGGSLPRDTLGGLCGKGAVNIFPR